MVGSSSNNPHSGNLEGRVDLLESKVSRLEESVNRAVGDLLPKVEALLSERKEAGEPAASSPAPPRTAAAPSIFLNFFNLWFIIACCISFGIQQALVAAPPTSLLELAERGEGEALLRMLAEEQLDFLRYPRTSSGDTALHVAPSGGHLKAVIVLLGVGAHVDVSGRRLRTPLHCAAAHGHLAVAQRLLYAGAKVNVKDADGATALELAAREGFKEVVELFLQRGASVDACNGDGESLLVQAARAKRWEIVDLLLVKGASATKCIEDKECALVLASRDGQADAVRHLLRRGGATNTNQVKLALGEAKSAAVVWAFMGSVPDQVLGEAGRWGLWYAAWGGRLEPLVALLEAGVQIDAVTAVHGKSALHYASANGQVQCVKELVLHGADVNAKSKQGNTPLHCASDAGHAECVRALLAAGADTSERNNEGRTPLEVAKNEEVRRAFNFW